MIRSARLQFRRFRSNDLNSIVALESNATVLRHTGIRFPHSPEVSASRLKAWIQRDDGKLGIFAGELVESPHEFVGWFMVLPEEGEWPELGFMLAIEQWGKGYASEAVEALAKYSLQQEGVPGLRAFTDLDNLASRRVLEKCGFQFQGTVKKFDQKLGKEVDLTLYRREFTTPGP